MRAELRMPNYSLNSGTTSIKQYLGHRAEYGLFSERKKEKKISKETKKFK